MIPPDIPIAVSCDFQIKESPLSHTYDLMALKHRVMDLFQWYDKDEIRNKYLAPYFPLIQSSGLGKTKLLYELKQDIVTNEVVLEEGMKREPDPQLKYREVEKDLEHACRYYSGKPTILLLDEAQNLLVGKDNHLFKHRVQTTQFHDLPQVNKSRATLRVG
jgi:hypothetical protein